MRNFFLLTLLFAAMLSASAADYAYLVFELADGQKVSVPASSLTLDISGNTLTAGSNSFTLSNLNKMYFSEVEVSSGIQGVSIDDPDESAEVYDLNGRKVMKDQMKNGVYVIKSKSGTYKIGVK